MVTRKDPPSAAKAKRAAGTDPDPEPGGAPDESTPTRGKPVTSGKPRSAKKTGASVTDSDGEVSSRSVGRSRGMSDGPRTRGGWDAVGTAAARRERQDTAGTDRGERTRVALIEAALRVFERDGYFEARVQDIVKEAGVSHGTFYTYFSSKRDILGAITTEFRSLVEAAVSRDSSRGDRVAALRRSNERYLDVYENNHAVMALIEHLATFDPELHAVRLARRRYHVERVAATIRRWQKEGVADPDVDPATTAGALVSMLSNFSYWWFVGGDSYDRDQATETLTRIWARAVGLKGPQATDD